MGEADSNIEQQKIKQLKQELIDAIDKQKESPSQRATKIYEILKEQDDITNWDVVCFCVEYLGLMIEVMPHMEQHVKKIIRLVYTQHYMIAGETNPLEEMKLKKG